MRRSGERSANPGFGTSPYLSVLLQVTFKFLLQQAQTEKGVIQSLLFLGTWSRGSGLDALQDCPMGVSNPLLQFAEICFRGGEPVKLVPIRKWKRSVGSHEDSYEEC
jgi:hypothetical protein